MSHYLFAAFIAAGLVSSAIYADTGSLIFAFMGYSWAGAMALFAMFLVDMMKEHQSFSEE